MSLVSVYSLNSNANDLIGSNNGTATNMTRGDGKTNKCGNFSGSSSYILINSNLGLSSTSSNTVGGWFYNTSGSGTQYRLDWFTTLGSSKRLLLYSSSGVLYHYNNGNQYTDGSSFLNKWVYIVIVNSPSKSDLYINGLYVWSVNTGSSTRSLNGLSLGCPYDNPSVSNFIGKQDEIFIDNTGWTPAQIKDKYLYYNGLF